jgi:hypothetical protein
MQLAEVRDGRKGRGVVSRDFCTLVQRQLFELRQSAKQLKVIVAALHTIQLE